MSPWVAPAQPKRSTQRRIPRGHDDEEEQLTADIIELARQCGRYSDRKIAALLAGCGLAGQ
jgi:hypothetical protein